MVFLYQVGDEPRKFFQSADATVSDMADVYQLLKSGRILRQFHTRIAGFVDLFITTMVDLPNARTAHTIAGRLAVRWLTHVSTRFTNTRR